MSLATLDELQASIEWTLSEDETGLAAYALEHASELVKTYGLPWTPESVPPLVKHIVIAAAAKFLRNPDGYSQSRAGDETVAWSSEAASGGVTLTPDQIDLCERMAGRSSLDTWEVTAWGPSTYPRSRGYTEYVPTQPGTTPFPFWGEPW